MDPARSRPLAWLAAAVALSLAPALVAPGVLAEDAAIMARYVGHIAAGHGVVWNAGDAPVDGATDLVPAFVAATFVRAGLDAVSALRVLATAAHLALLAGLWIAGRRAGMPARVRALLLLPIAWGPAAAYVAAGFLAPVMALWAGGVRAVGASVWEASGTTLGRAGFAVLAVTLGMIRPEGVLLAIAVTLSLAVERPARARQILTWTAAAFATVGVAYWALRLQYFGHLLPAPAYVKGDYRFHVDGLAGAMVAGVLLMGPLAWPAWLSARNARHAIALWGAPLAFLGVWILLSAETNYAYRFQYPVAAVLLWPVVMSWPHWPAAARAVASGRRFAVVTVLLSAITFAIFFPWPMQDGRDVVGRALADIPGTHTMAVSEAGLVPFRSGWRVVDAYGLNDYAIAREGVSQERLEAEQPDLILVTGALDAVLRPQTAPDGDRWDRMVTTLATYANTHGYVLAAFWGQSPQRGHAYFVRAGAPNRDRIVAAVRPASYGWLRPRTRNVWRRWRAVAGDWLTGAHVRERAVNVVPADRP